MTSPESEVPFYIDAEAEHPASILRTLAWAATEGKQGILSPGALAPRAMSTPGKGLMLDPGPFAVNARHPGGSFQNYVDALLTARFVPLSDVPSSGPRTDLIIARVENPYAGEPTTWTPVDPEDGPYRRFLAVEGVGSGISSVLAWNNTWSAIPIARVTRPANTGNVLQSHITDLRSLADLGGDRLVDIDWPAGPPPVASEYYTNFNPSAGDPNYGKPTGGSDNVHNYWVADTGWKDWPSVANWDVPIPEWATSMDIELTIMNAQLLTNEVYAKQRIALTRSGVTTAYVPELTVAIDWTGTPGRYNINYGGAMLIPTAMRGRIVNFKNQLASYYSTPGRLDAKGGTTTRLAVNFKRVPVL